MAHQLAFVLQEFFATILLRVLYHAQHRYVDLLVPMYHQHVDQA